MTLSHILPGLVFSVSDTINKRKTQTNFQDTHNFLSNTEEEGDTSDRMPKVVINIYVRTDPRRQLASYITSCEPVQDRKRRELFARLADVTQTKARSGSKRTSEEQQDNKRLKQCRKCNGVTSSLGRKGLC